MLTFHLYPPDRGIALIYLNLLNHLTHTETMNFYFELIHHKRFI